MRHPVAKDATDLALALDEAEASLGGPRRAWSSSVGVDGGRLDHLLAGVLALADPGWAAPRACAPTSAPATVHVLHGPAERDSTAPSRATCSTLSPSAGRPRASAPTGSATRSPARRCTPAPPAASATCRQRPATVALDAGTLLAVLPAPEAPG